MLYLIKNILLITLNNNIDTNINNKNIPNKFKKNIFYIVQTLHHLRIN